jgi:uncharacterized protein (DUF2141 family)
MANPESPIVPMFDSRVVLSGIAVLFASAACIPQQPPQGRPATDSSAGCTLRIHVDGLRNSSGVVGSTIFKSPDGWPEDNSKAFLHGPTPIAPGERQATAVWEHLPPGDYGVAVIHDENSNHKLDRNFIGIPKEGFGFANNPHVGLSAPSFQAALVHVQCPATEITIHLQYK